MSDRYLTTREFDTWRESHDGKIDRILDHIESQSERNLAVEARMTMLETQQRSAHRLYAKVAGAIGAVVAAIIAGVFHLLGK